MLCTCATESSECEELQWKKVQLAEQLCNACKDMQQAARQSCNITYALCSAVSQAKPAEGHLALTQIWEALGSPTGPAACAASHACPMQLRWVLFTALGTQCTSSAPARYHQSDSLLLPLLPLSLRRLRLLCLLRFSFFDFFSFLPFFSFFFFFCSFFHLQSVSRCRAPEQCRA